MSFNFYSARNNKKNEDKEEDYYKLLEVNQDASFEEIKKAYRRLSMLHHPDKNGNCEESTIKFKKLANAYETLSDEDKRMMYDMGIRSGNMDGGGATPFDMNINPFDIFNMIFGQQHNQGQQQQRKQHFSNFHDVGNPSGLSSFMKFAMPMPMSMSMSMPMSMPMGMGVHIINPEYMEHGHMSDVPGFIYSERSERKEQEKEDAFEKSNIYITLEDAYNGIEKYVAKVKEQEVCICIPAGINDKELIITTTPSGKMVNIVVNIKPDKLFKRNGLDLIFEKEITLKESLCGLEFSIKHVNGKTFHLQHKDGTTMKDGVSKTIQGLGMKDSNGVIGALVIVFKVIYPDKLTKEQIEKLYEIL